MVSVIIPIYNTAEYLREALDSVVAQTYADWECICVDDGSTDGSGDIVQEYADRDSRFMLIRQANAGQSVARNTALHHVRGSYIYMMDSDDVLEPTLLDEAVQRAEETQADVVFFNASVMGEAWCDYSLATGCPSGVMSGEELLRHAMNRYNYRCCVWLMLIRADASIPDFWPGIIHEDELFSARLYASARRVAALDRQLLRHRVRSGSTMRRAFSLRNIECYIIVCRELQWLDVPVLAEMAAYIIPAIFRTAATLPLGQKLTAFMHMKKAGWLHHVSMRAILRFWL